MRLPSLEGDEFDLEDERRSGRNDTPGADVSVSKVCGNREAAPATHFHPKNALVPAFDNRSGAEREREGGP